MNLTSWALVTIGTILFLWGTLKVEKRLSYADMTKLLNNRQQYLPQLRDTMDKMLARMKELAIEAGRLPLEEYYERYLTDNNAYQCAYNKQGGKQKDKAVKRKVAIITALHKLKFAKNNVYLSELEDRDDKLVALKKEYDALCARNSDRKLARRLDRLFEYAKQMFSCYTIVEMGKCNNLPYKHPKYVAGLYDTPNILDEWLKGKRSSTNRRFDELSRGEDL